MLHLNRKKNESIFIEHVDTGEVIELVVLEVKGKTVKLGFENESKSHTILRKEVKQKQLGNENPNPFYRDRIPSYWRTIKFPTPPSDGLEELVDTLIPSTEDIKEPAA
jgi:carbon storage regulator CsrA